MFKYLKKAFLNQWNLLTLGGGLGVAVLAGLTDPALMLGLGALVAAGELGFLAMLSAHPKFRAYVEAQEAKVIREARNVSVENQVERILAALPREARDRYEQLRSRCVDLQQIADDLKSSQGVVGTTLQSFQSQGLDRLLWIFLRLLFTRQSMDRFLRQTRVESIERDIERLGNRRRQVEKDDTPHGEKLRRTIEDNLKTCRDRLENYRRAQANHEFVELEIDRLENKIKSLAEVAVNRQEPDYVAGQVDAVAGSMLETEQTISELDFVTGLGTADDEVPSLLFPPVHVVE